MDHIWEITDIDDFISAMAEKLDEKTQYGDDMSVLTSEERIFYITQTLDMEVNNGGFSQFFYNSSGNFANEVVNALQTIGAYNVAEICQKAIDAYGRPIPVDQEEREKMLDELENDEIDEILGECDDAFYEYPDNLSELNYDFVRKNRNQFE